MTQVKPAKKKKKGGKDEKGKKNEKKAENARPPTPVDKKLVARNNVREMLLQAQMMHKNHLRSKVTKRRTTQSEVPVQGSSSTMEYDPRFISSESIKIRNKASASGKLEEARRKPESETVRKMASGELVARKMEEMARRKKSEEFPPKKEVRRKSSAEYPARKKEEEEAAIHRKRSAEHRKRDEGSRKEGKVSRKGSAEYPIRKKEEFLHRQSSAEYPARKATGEGGTKIDDYHVGVPPFVSLELLDKMKCHNSSSSINVKKGILRQASPVKSREGSRQQSKTSVGAKGAKTKRKATDEGKTPYQDADTKKSKKSTKKASDCDPVQAATPPPPPPPSKADQTSRNVQSASSNFDSVATGDPFSSNTSRSYLSSDSDVSKIDRKFMQILEAVTLNQFKVGFDESHHHKLVSEHQKLTQAAKESEESKPPTAETQVPQTQVTATALQAAEEVKAKKSGSSVAEAEKARSTKDDVKEIWVKDQREGGDPQTEKALKRAVRPESPEEEEGDGKKPVRKVLDADPLTSQERKPEAKKSEAKKSEGVKTPPSPKAEEPKPPGDTDARKRVKTWSIIKRLEKAFLTLGLNLEDLDNSDEDEDDDDEEEEEEEEDSPPEEKKKKKKKIRERRPTSKAEEERKGSAKSDGSKKSEPASNSSSSRAPKKPRKKAETLRVDKYGVESNGSGDRNQDALRPGKLATAPKEKRIKNRGEEEGGSLAYYTAVNNRIKDGKLSTKWEGEAGKRDVPEEGGCVSASSRETQNRFDSYYEKKAKNLRKHAKRPKRSHLDDIQVGRSAAKHRSDYSVSVSCSASSLSEEDEFKKHKRKKKSSPPRRRALKAAVSKEDVWKIASTGKGDAATTTTTTTMPTPTPDAVEIFGNVRRVAKADVGTDMSVSAVERNLEFNRMSEANELELRQIRARHKQLISEIKASLDEIRKQHQMYTRIQKETKRFNRDCHTKRKLLASYLRDVKASHEQRSRLLAEKPRIERKVHIRLERVVSEEKHRFKLGDMSEYNVHMTKLRKRLQRNPLLYRAERFEVSDSVRSTFGTSNDVSTVSDEMEDVEESSMIDRSTTDVESSDDTADEYKSFISVISSVRNVTLDASKDPAADDPCSSDPSGNREIPGYMVQLVEKLNALIQGQKSQLHNLVVNASGTSNNTSVSDRVRQTGSTNSSGSNLPKHAHAAAEERTSSERRTASPGHKTSSTSVGKGGVRQHKAKAQGSKKSNHEKVPEPEVAGIPMSKSGALIQGDPGGGSVESVFEPEPEMMLTESFPAADGAVVPEKVEELRYRKGDPSFRFQGSLLECFGPHSSFGAKSSPEEEALKRRNELERILKHDDGGKHFSKHSDGRHAQEHEHVKGKHSSYIRHRKKSLIIDHNKGEENEESETVLGHASRHIGANIRQLERKKMAHDYYLKADKKPTDPKSQTWRKHEAGRKVGRKFFEDFPFGYFGTPASFNGPESSHSRLKDAYCQTDVIDDYDDVDEIYLLDECGSMQSMMG